VNNFSKLMGEVWDARLSYLKKAQRMAFSLVVYFCAKK
jgi:hypothetical protein